MAAYEWVLLDIVALIYNISWLVFLTNRHFGQVTTTAGHIFELNVLLNSVISNILWIFLVDLEVVSLGVIVELLDFGVLLAIACSQIETMVFLKTLTVNTMMTNTAGKIILTMTIFSYGLAILNTFTWPSMMVPQSELLSSCAYFTPMTIDSKRKLTVVFIFTFALVIVLSVMGFGIFRSFQIIRKSDNEESPDNLSLGHNTPSQERLFTIQAMICELNQVTPHSNKY